MSSKVHTHEVRSNAAAVVTDAYVRFLITGIVGLAVDSGHTPLLAMMPDGRIARPSATDPAETIPPHHAFVMFPLAAATGREADLTLGSGTLGVCLLEHELLTLAGGTIASLPGGGSSSEIIDFAKVCGHTFAAKSCVSFPPNDNVLAQVSLPSNALWSQSLSTDSYTFQPPCSLVTAPQSGQLAEVAAVDLHITDASTLMLVSHAFGGGASRDALELALDGTTSAAPLVITIGNAPLADLQRYVDGTPGGHEHDRDVHFELYYRLAATNPPLPPVIPFKVLMKVPHASNCPVALMPVEP